MQKISRVVDLIVELEKHDPVAPVEVWGIDEEGELRVMSASQVEQMTPMKVKAGGYFCKQLEATEALPVVIWVD